jgi:ABC-2 type transport system permease protein
VGRALRWAATSLRIAVLHELQYRVNFYLQLVQALVAAGTALAVLALVFRYTPTVGGWSRDQLLVVLGVHVLLGGVVRTVVQPNMSQLLQDIRRGTLDFALVKPLDAQWLTSTRQWQVWHLADVVVGGVLVATGVARLGGAAPADLALFAATLAVGAVLIYCAWLAVTVTGFWAVRMEVLVELFEGLYQAGRWPVTVYPGWLRLTFTFVVPLAFAVTVPAQALTHQLTATATLAAAGLAAVLLVATRLFWRVGLRHYSGASA